MIELLALGLLIRLGVLFLCGVVVGYVLNDWRRARRRRREVRWR